ncbi:GntR family transcriptional regulator [Micromonospora sp. NPDC048999]|uniref:GntR family transcriptional regulator n=1 Tax=Micromonospora sp. NPDC048999 TaxID=3155391 RepID=UPI0033D74B75
MIVEVDTASAVPAYEQIRAQLATMIETGVLAPGTKLPPVRQLAADLGLAVNTVARAYTELDRAGLVTSRVRHGTVVAPHQAIGQPEIRRRLAEAADSFAAIAGRLGVTPDESLDAVRKALHR